MVLSTEVGAGSLPCNCDVRPYMSLMLPDLTQYMVLRAHGLGSNKLMGLANYVQAFSAAGYACVVFDYRRWGGSGEHCNCTSDVLCDSHALLSLLHQDGSPRHCLYITEQLDDYRTVVKYCRQQPELDPQRVVLWGTSLSGGHVALLATEVGLRNLFQSLAAHIDTQRKLNLSAAIVQCPWLGVGQSPSMTSLPFLKLFVYGCLDVLKQAVGLGPLYIPTASEPGQVAVLTTPDSPMLMKLAYEKGCVTFTLYLFHLPITSI